MQNLQDSLLQTYSHQDEALTDGTERLFVLPSGIVLLHGWSGSQVFDPSKQKVVLKKDFGGCMVYPQMDGEVFFRNNTGSGWFQADGQLTLPIKTTMSALAAYGDRLWVFGPWKGKPDGLHEINRKDLSHVRLLLKDDGEQQPATNLLFSRDGKRVLMARYSDGYVGEIWDAETGKKLMDLEAKMGNEDSPFTFESRLVASIGDLGTQVWDSTTGKSLFVCPDEIYHAALQFSPSEKYLYAVRSEGVEVWDVAEGAQVAAWEPADGILAATFRGDQVWVLLENGTLQAFDLKGIAYR